MRNVELQSCVHDTKIKMGDTLNYVSKGLLNQSMLKILFGKGSKDIFRERLGQDSLSQNNQF